jgi:hypothetical protein
MAMVPFRLTNKWRNRSRFTLTRTKGRRRSRRWQQRGQTDQPKGPLCHGKASSNHHRFRPRKQVIECSIPARLLFIGLWNFCDDAGRMPLSPKTIKFRLFPGDDLSFDDIRRMIDELSTNGLIEIYIVDGIELLRITGWEKHQKIDRRQAPKYPGPADHSPNGQLPLGDHSLVDMDQGSGRDQGRDQGEGDSASQKRRAKPRRQFPDDFHLDSDGLRVARDNGFDEQQAAALFTRFRDYALANGKLYADCRLAQLVRQRRKVLWAATVKRHLAAGERGDRMTRRIPLDEVLRMLASVGADPRHFSGTRVFRCPACSHLRKKKFKKCLSIHSDADGFFFRCFHCDEFHGSYRYDDTRTTSRRILRSKGDIARAGYKVRNLYGGNRW